MTPLHPEADAENEWKSGPEPRMGSVASQGPDFQESAVARGEMWQERDSREAGGCMGTGCVQLHKAAHLKGPALRSMLCWGHFEIVIVFEQVHFHFALGPTVHAAGPVRRMFLTGSAVAESRGKAEGTERDN